LLPDVSQEIQRSLLSRESGGFPLGKRQTTETSLPNVASRESQPGRDSPVTTHELIGTRLDGKYRLERELRRDPAATRFGGAGPTGERVWIQILSLDPSDGGGLQRGVEVLATLAHPNLVGVADHGRDGATGRHYLVMRGAEGDFLSTLTEAGRASSELAAVVA